MKKTDYTNMASSLIFVLTILMINILFSIFHNIASAEDIKPSLETQIQDTLKIQKQNLIRARLKNKIDTLYRENKLAPILIPILLQKIEDSLMYQKYLYSKEAITGLQEINEAYKDIIKEKTIPFHGRIKTTFDLKNRADQIRLGRLIVTTIDPVFEQKIRQSVQRSLSPQNPHFFWKSPSRSPTTPIIKRQIITPIPNETKFKINSIINQISNKQADRKTQAFLLQHLLSLIKTSSFTSNLQVDLSRKLNPGQLRPYIPDLNYQHSIKNYYQYKVDLEKLECINKNESSPDEVYLIIQTILPRFDAKDSIYAHELSAGKLYNTATHATSTYGGVEQGEVINFWAYDKNLFWQNLYNTQATFILDLYEEDYSKAQMVAGYQEASIKLRQILTSEIKTAVIEYVKSVIVDAIGSALTPQIAVIVDSIFSGQFNESMISQLNNSLGSIKADLILLGMIFSGKSFEEVLGWLSAGNPELFLVMTAIEVCGPILIDFLQGDWQDGFRALLTLPLTVLQSLISVFTDLDDFFNNLIVMLDPDDHIQTRKIIIREATSNLATDADWDQRDIPPAGGYGHSDFPPTHMYSMQLNIQPQLWFATGLTFYKLYYNVERVLYGGKEVFGFTLDPYRGINVLTKTYKVKSPYNGDPIKVKISTLNTMDMPFVYMSGLGGANGNFSGERTFEVPGFHDRDYTITIVNVTGKPIYGYISVEENNSPQPWKGASSGASQSGGSGSSHEDGNRLLK